MARRWGRARDGADRIVSVRGMERTIAGRYVLRGPLGTGGMADVFVADDVRLHRQVAVKLVPAAAITPTVRARFVREARSAARIVHPNAVIVYDAGESEGFLYLVMERVSGHTLAEQLATTGPLPAHEAATIAIAVLGAVGAAHAAGVVHRDVKPANIIVGPGGVKLVDFGIATLLDEAGTAVTAAGELVGTPKYLAPEQISGQPATPATDVYAVGVVLFEMLTGSAPFERSTPVATALAHREEAPPDVRTLRSDVPPRVAAVVTTALQKNPADRYHSAAEMQRALVPCRHRRLRRGDCRAHRAGDGGGNATKRAGVVVDRCCHPGRGRGDRGGGGRHQRRRRLRRAGRIDDGRGVDHGDSDHDGDHRRADDHDTADDHRTSGSGGAGDARATDRPVRRRPGARTARARPS